LKRDRVEELFYIRAICAFGIFIIHLSGSFALSSSFGSRAMHFGIIINQFFRFGTPIFMMLSGFVLFYNYRSFEEFDFGNFYRKKVKYILIPYILWSFLYYTILPYLLRTPFSHLLISFKGILSAVNFDSIKFLKVISLGIAYPHLYFIFLIFQFYLLYPLFIKFLIKPMKEKPIIVFGVCAIIQGIILIYGFKFKFHSKYFIISFFNSYYWKSIFGWFYYFLTGGILALHYKKISQFIDRNIIKIFPVYMLSVLFYIGEVYDSIRKAGGRDFYEKYGSIRPTTIVYATFTMVILVWLSRKIVNSEFRYKNLIKGWGIYSLGIYFLHPFILELVKVKIINKYPSLGYDRVSTLIFLIVFGWTLTVTSVLVLSKLRFKNFIVGKVPSYKIFSAKLESRKKLEAEN